MPNDAPLSKPPLSESPLVKSLVASRAYLTVVTRSHLNFAIALAESLYTAEPEVPFYILVADRQRKDAGADPGLARLSHEQLLFIDDLDILNLQRFTFQYTAFELVCACKAFGISELLRRGFDAVVYLDADIWVYRSLETIWQLLEEYSIILTPHVIHPHPLDGKRPTDAEYLKVGVFNAGFIAIRGDDTGKAMLDWWRSQMQTECYVDILNHHFVDQKWLDLVPGLFDSVHVLRQPGFNAGHWSLSQHPISEGGDGSFRIGQQPLVFFHFSKFLPDAPFAFEKQQTRLRWEDSPTLKRLVVEYHAHLQVAGNDDRHNAKQTKYGFATMNCGTLIQIHWREAIRRGHPYLKTIENPFDSRTNPSLIRHFTSIESEATSWRADWRYGIPKKSWLSRTWKKLRNDIVSRWRK